ncbi:hypothetical protein LNO81_30395 [Klebsiella variicola subsp. variicola]|nr:hypothetical protein [Klebsiella variicola subsp. variicola]
MFPLRVIETLTTQTFSPPLFAALCSPNLILAVQRLATYKKLVCPMELILDVGREGDLTVSPRWLTLQPEAPLSLQIAEIAFFVVCQTRNPRACPRTSFGTVRQSSRIRCPTL